MFTVNYQTSPIKAMKPSEHGFRGFNAHKRFKKCTARRPETLSKELQMVLGEVGYGGARENLDILALDRDVLNKGSYNHG